MVYPWYNSAGSWNNTLWHYKDPEVDKVLDAARTTTDKAVQAKLYGRFQELVLDDPPGSVIYVQNFVCGASNKVRGLAISPLILMDFGKTMVIA